ncbi:MAG: NHL repeat-containing protein [Planctomycetota bacterium]
MVKLFVRLFSISRPVLHTQKHIFHKTTGTRNLIFFIAAGLSLVLLSFKPTLAGPSPLNLQKAVGETDLGNDESLQQTGSLQVIILPQEAIDDGAQWRIDGGSWRDSNDIAIGLTAGYHTVEYQSITNWNAPGYEGIQINDGQTTTIYRTYTRQTGLLYVTILPQEAIDANAQWRVDGGIWHDSGYTEPNLVVGLHTVEYKPIANFNEPNSQTVQIYHAQPTITSGTYIPTGSLQVTILPQAAVDANAQWRVDGGTWRDSNDTETDLVIGYHTVEYKTIFGFNKPNSQELPIDHAQTTTTTGTYVQQLGSLQVIILPQAAIDAGAQWRIDAGAWHDSNDTEPNLTVGLHTVEYKPITNWNEPNSETVMINYGLTTTTLGTYIQAGSVQVTIAPQEAIDANAQWRVDGRAWRDSNDMETNLAIGMHTVEYRQISSWKEPNSETLLINFGQTTTTSGTYTQAGSLLVTISPQEAIDANAQWRVDGGSWRDSNDIQNHLPVGSHMVEYKQIYGWNEPNNQTVQINRAQMTTTVGTYVRQRGSLLVTILPPEANDAGAQWRVDGGPWLDSNDTEPNLAVGLHTVEYKPIINWIEPNSHTVQIDHLQTTAISKTYLRSGAVQVTIVPQEAADVGAQWRVDGGSWQNSNNISRPLPVGPHTVEYKSIFGWNEPNSHIVNINHSQVTTTAGTYVRQRGSLQVIILPTEAVVAAAQWRIDGGTWHDSNDIETYLTVGFHTIEYKSPGIAWIVPANETVQILYNQTTTITITYIKRTPSGAPPLQWQTTFGGSDWDLGESTHQTSDGGYITVGHTFSNITFDYDIYLIKSEPNGNMQWEEFFGGDDWDRAFSVKQTSDGGYIIAGFTYSYGNGESDVYLVKVDSSGDMDWDQYFGGDYWDEGYSVQQTSDGGYIIVGSTFSFGAGEYDVYLIKTLPNGHKEYEQYFGGTGDDSAWSVWQTSDGGYIIAGHTESFGAGGQDVYLIKTDPATESEWQKTFGGINNNVAYSVQQTLDSGYIIAGHTSYWCPHLGEFQDDVYLIKTDTNGIQQWSKNYPGSDDYCSGDDIGYAAQQTSDGGYIIAGETQSYGPGSGDVYLVKTDSNGNKLWQKAFGNTDSEYATAVQQTSDDGFIVAGTTYSSISSDYDIYLAKVCPDGTSSADFNCDGIVYYEDLETLLGQWLQPPTFTSADIAPEFGDGIINGLDFAVLVNDWLLETIKP